MGRLSIQLAALLAPLLLCAHSSAAQTVWPDLQPVLQAYELRGPEPVLPDPQQPLPGYRTWSDLYESDARAMRLNGDPGTLVCDDSDPDPANHCFDPSLVGFTWPNMVTTHYSLTSAVNADGTIIALDNNEQCDAFGTCETASGGFRSLYLAGPEHTEPLGRPLYMRWNHHGDRSCEERWHPIEPLDRIQVCHDDTIQLLHVDLPEGSNQTQLLDLAALAFVDAAFGGGQKGQPSVLPGAVRIPVRATIEAVPWGGTYCLVYDIDQATILAQRRITTDEHATWFWCGLEPHGRYLAVYETENSTRTPGSITTYDVNVPLLVQAQIQLCEELSHFCYMTGPGPAYTPYVIGRRQFNDDCLTTPAGEHPMLRGDLQTGAISEVSPDVQASHTACMGEVMGVDPHQGWAIASQHSHQALVHVSADTSQRRVFVAWLRSLDFEPPHLLDGTDFEKNSEPQCTNAGMCQAVCATNWGSTSSINTILFDWKAQCDLAGVPAFGPAQTAAAGLMLLGAGAWLIRQRAASPR